jgi:predicted transposase YdaD
VDLLVKARFRGFGEGYFLIHVESQAQAKPGFGRRFFHYFALLDMKFDLPVFPVVLFSYDRPLRPEPDRYQVDFPRQRVLDFSFRVIQLNRLNWRDFLRNPNPVASALMTKMQIAPEDRPRVKLECLRMLATLKLDKARATLISTFMDTYLKLTAAESVVYNRELEAIEPKEREVVMQLTNEWIEAGKVEGRQEGHLEGRRELVIRLLRRRLGNVPPELVDRIRQLSDSQVDEFGEALLDFQNVSDAQAWLR